MTVHAFSRIWELARRWMEFIKLLYCSNKLQVINVLCSVRVGRFNVIHRLNTHLIGGHS